MLTKLAKRIKLPNWAQESPRYVRLTVLDHLLDGTIYDDLPYAFYDEKDDQGKYIRIEDRRPSVQYNLPSYIAKTTARKLFAGTHCPKLIHPDEEITEALKTLANSSNLFAYMLQASIWASVGSVAITFKLIEGKYLLEVWRARFCFPEFAVDGQLSKLRIAYLSRDWGHVEKDSDGDLINSQVSYWFVRDLDAEGEVNYQPIRETKWNPINGDSAELKPYPEGGPVEGVILHNLKMIPAQWVVNLAGGEFPDGASTFGPAIVMALDMDYTMSQIGRGVRYNAAPQLVLRGEAANLSTDEGIARSPTNVIQMKGGMKDQTGMSFEAGDAKLLEMTGTGIDAGLKYVAALRKFALETVAAARKDPERTKGPLSGKAVEALDDQFVDLIQELRSSLGDTGLLSLLKKMVIAGIRTGHELFTDMSESDAEDIGLVWKRAIPTAPEALVQIASAMEVLVNNGIMDLEVAQRYIHMALDLDALEAQQAVQNTMQTDPPPEPTPNEHDTPSIVQQIPDASSGGEVRVSLGGGPRSPVR